MTELSLLGDQSI